MIIRSLRPRLLIILPRPGPSVSLFALQFPRALPFSANYRFRLSSSSSSADAQITHLQDLYATAKDELEIASEETEKKSVYAAEDRNAAVDAFQDL